MQENGHEGDSGAAAPAHAGGEGVLEGADDLKLYSGGKHVATLKEQLQPPESLTVDSLRLVEHRYQRFEWEHLQALLALQGADTFQLLGERYIIVGGTACRPPHQLYLGYDRPVVLEVVDNPEELGREHIFEAYCAGGYY